jgi:hypothetical protein
MAGEQGESGMIHFRAPADLIAAAKRAAAVEGLSLSAVAKRALLRDLAKANVGEPQPEAR